VAGALVDELPPREHRARRDPLALDDLVARAIAAEPRLMPTSLAFRDYAFEESAVDVRGDVKGQPFGEGFVRMRAYDGRVELIETPDHSRAVGTVMSWLHSLHTVHYGGTAVRLLLALLALGGCVTILTGNWLWLLRRAGQAPSLGHALLARLTAGVGAGTPVAVASLLLASRWLSWNWPGRGQAEEQILAATFAGCVVWALVCRDTIAVWWQQLSLAAAVLACVPIAATQVSAAGLFGAGPKLDRVVSVELGFLSAAGLLLTAALVVRRRARGTYSQRADAYPSSAAGSRAS
jgi:hypothetical protein